MNPRNVAIIPIYRPLADLQADNHVYYAGQHVWVIASTNPRKLGLKIGDWDWKNDPNKLLASAFNDLPWEIAPTATGNPGFTPFKVRNTSALEPKYEEIGSDVVITDARLIDAQEAVVFNTALNTEFRDAEMLLDNVAGTLTLYNFSLPAGDHISITVPSVITPAASVTALTTRVGKLELYTLPFATGGAIYIWNKPVAFIPTEFQEVTDFDGKFIVGRHPLTEDYPDYEDVGNDGGSSKHVVDATKNVKRFRLFTAVDQYAPLAGHPVDFARAISAIRSMVRYFYKSDVPPAGGGEGYELCGSEANNQEPTLSPTSWIGKTDAEIEPIDHRPEYRVVAFIELKPAYQIP